MPSRAVTTKRSQSAPPSISGRRPRRRFDIHEVLRRLRAAAPGWNAPVVTLIAVQSQDPFRVLISCLLSLRTKDETTGPAARRLFALADTPAALRKLTPAAIEQAIFPSASIGPRRGCCGTSVGS